MSQPIIESSLTKPYIEVLIPGPQGPPGEGGTEFLVYSGSAYPTRSTSNPVIFVGPVDPDTLMTDPDDQWIDTSSGSAPVTSVNGETGVVVLDATDVGAKSSSYVPAWSEITGKPDYDTQLAAKLSTSSAPELIRDTMGTALVAGSNMTVTVNDAGDTITLASTGGGGGAVDSVNGQTGVVVLTAADVTAVPTSRTVNGHDLTANVTITKSDLGLGSVDNTADSAKAVLSASKLTTARTINGVSFDGTANITLTSTSSFVMSGNVPGELITDDLVPGGVSIPVNCTLDKMLLNLDIEPRGSSAVINVIKRTRTTGVDSTIGTATFTAGSRRVTLTGLATSLLVDDRIRFQCTSLGSQSPGTSLNWTMSDSAGTTFPTALSAPSAVTSATAVVSGSADVSVSWTAPASGAYYAVDVWKDGQFLTRVPRGTTSFLDAGAADAAHSYVLYAVNGDTTSTGVTANYTVATATIGTPVPIGFGIANTTGTVVSMTTTTGVASGDVIVLMGAGTVPTGLTETWTVTDSRSNTWTTHVHAYDNTQGQQSWIASARVTTNILAGDTITCTGTNGTARLVITAYSVSGIAASSRFDKSAGFVSTTASRNLTTTATTALAQTNEIAFSCFSSLTANSGTATTPVVAGSGWSIGTVQATTQGSNDRMVTPQWRITNATTALTGTCTLNASSQYAGAIATFKGA